MTTTPPLKLPYTEAESDAASRDWNASCGPHSIAAACQRPLEDVRAAIPNYRGWMSPTQILKTLHHLGEPFVYRTNLRQQEIPTSSFRQILRIQFEGSWLNPGVPVGAAYQKTHYIAIVAEGRVMDTMYDTCVLWRPDNWLADQHLNVVTAIPKATGWHFTHVWELK